MHTAQQVFTEDELLDVGIVTFAPGNTNETALAGQSSSAAIRKSETHYIPAHLKTTLERTGYWGDVRVQPVPMPGVDVRVEGEILESNGERLAVAVKVSDVQGYTWFERQYQAKADSGQYSRASRGKRDPYQRIYNSIANDMAAVRRRMEKAEVRAVQRSSDLRFAAELVPGAFEAYTETSPDGKIEVVRLPAENDPMWQRVRKVMGRQQMLVDTLNAYYEPYYREMWAGYLDWRKMNLVETLALRDAKGSGFKQVAMGIAMIAAAILLEVNDVDNVSTLRDVLVIGGSQVIVQGVNISQQAELHTASLEELSESFGADMQTVVVNLEGETYELRGTAEEQMAQWKEILKKIYHRENARPGETQGRPAVPPDTPEK